MTRGHVLGIALGIVMGVLVLNVLLPRLPIWLGLVKKKPPVPFVINGDF
jgi:hypothetical protein